jgi:hypothetical protein
MSIESEALQKKKDEVKVLADSLLARTDMAKEDGEIVSAVIDLLGWISPLVINERAANSYIDLLTQIEAVLSAYREVKENGSTFSHLVDVETFKHLDRALFLGIRKRIRNEVNLVGLPVEGLRPVDRANLS